MYTKYDRYHILQNLDKIEKYGIYLGFIWKKKTFEILNILTSENYNLSAKCLNLIFKKGFHNLHVVEELCLFQPTIQYLNWFVPEFDSFRKVSFLSIVLFLLDCTSSL